MKLTEHHSLKQMNTFGMDVRARYYGEVQDTGSLQALFSGGQELPGPLLVLGGGSNVLFTGDFPGTVLRMRLQGRQVVETHPGQVVVEVMAGEDWDELVAWTVENGWGGLENLSLIPGQAGTSPIQNIGAYGVELKDVFVSLTALEKSNASLHTFSHADCRFGYRDSIFKREARDRYIIVSIRLRLSTRDHNIQTGYGAILQELKAMGVEQPGIASVRQAVCNIRNSKLPDPKQTGNAGSFFKNPVVARDHFEKIQLNHPGVVAFPVDGGMKLAAGWLIEQAGWKGYRKGDAGVHERQALVLVNHGNATGKEMIALARNIQHSVQEKFGVALEPEVNIL